jgi:hypothetical protein
MSCKVTRLGDASVFGPCNVNGVRDMPGATEDKMTATADTWTSHKGECKSYARSVAERDSWTFDPDEIDQIASAYLSDGTVSCICAELPN